MILKNKYALWSMVFFFTLLICILLRVLWLTIGGWEYPFYALGLSGSWKRITIEEVDKWVWSIAIFLGYCVLLTRTLNYFQYE